MKSILVTLSSALILSASLTGNALTVIEAGRSNAKQILTEAILKRNNFWLVGSQGSGKVYLTQAIAKELGVPFAIYDSTNVSPAGYIGGKISDVVTALAHAANFDKDKIERGIIVLDEFHKVARRSGRATMDAFRDRTQETIFWELLKGIEVKIPGPSGEITIDTSKILFVCVGFFDKVGADELLRYGIIQKIVDTLPIAVVLTALSKTDLVDILREPHSLLDEHRADFQKMGIELTFTDAAIEAIADKAFRLGHGSRSMRYEVASMLQNIDVRYGPFERLTSVTVTEGVVNSHEQPVLQYKAGLSLSDEANPRFAELFLTMVIKRQYARVNNGLRNENILLFGRPEQDALLTEHIAKQLNVPFARVEASNPPSDVIAALAHASDYDVEKIKRGIVFLDGIDMVARHLADFDEARLSLYAKWLRTLEGDIVEVTDGRGNRVEIDTSGIIFVCTGAFDGLAEVVRERLKSEGRAPLNNIFKHVTFWDLVKIRMLPEFVGRLPQRLALPHE